MRNTIEGMAARAAGLTLFAWLCGGQAAMGQALETAKAAQPRELLPASAAQARTLSNGLSVIVMERPGTGTFAGLTGCLAGYAFDPPGASGTAHLVEHFIASPTTSLISAPPEVWAELGKEYQKSGGAASPRTRELEAQIAAAGKSRASWDVATSADVVFYMVRDYPVQSVDRFMRAGAETLRMVPQGHLDTEKATLTAEIRRRAGEPMHAALSAEYGAAFGEHPYGAPTAGRVEEVERLTLESLRAFKRSYYSPDRCALTVVGDLRPALVFEMAERYLGSIAKEAPAPDMRRPARAAGERRARIEALGGPRITVSFFKPPMPSREDAVAEVVLALLARGKGSRVGAELVERSKAAATVAGGNGGQYQRADNLLTVLAVPSAGRAAAELEPAIVAQFERLRNEPVGGTELTAAIASVDDMLRQRYGIDSALANAMARSQLIAGDWKAMFTTWEMCRSVTADEIQAFARRYFVPDNRVVIELLAPATPATK